MSSNLQLAQDYIRAIEGGATGAALARFFTPDVVIQEMPNRIAPRGSTSDLTKALQSAERGKEELQNYQPVGGRQPRGVGN